MAIVILSLKHQLEGRGVLLRRHKTARAESRLPFRSRRMEEKNNAIGYRIRRRSTASTSLSLLLGDACCYRDDTPLAVPESERHDICISSSSQAKIPPNF